MRYFLLVSFSIFLFSGCIKPAIVKKDMPQPVQKENKVQENRVVVWDGDDYGVNAKGWVSCNQQGKCVSEVMALDGCGINDSVGLKWICRGKDWKGFGWNWFGWWPPDGGTDITKYSHLVFKVKAEFKDIKKLADIKAITVRLNSSGNDKAGTDSVPLGNYIVSLADKKWHEVVIPLSDLMQKEGKNFDMKTAWEFGVGEWSFSDNDYILYFDDISFEKR